MSLFVLDTDIVSLYWRGNSTVRQRADAQPSTDVAITVMWVDEQLAGWYTLVRQARDPRDIAHAYSQMATSVHHLARWPILTYTEQAIARVDQLKTLRLGVRIMDLRIAAIALEHGG